MQAQITIQRKDPYQTQALLMGQSKTEKIPKAVSVVAGLVIS